MAQPELDRLILNNLADLDAAATHVLDKLQPSVAKAMDEIVERFLQQGEWAGTARWQEREEIWLAHEDWRKNGVHTGEDFQSHFYLSKSLEQGPDNDMFWLTRLLGVGDRPVGMRWTRNDVKKKSWRIAVGAHPVLISKLRTLGFLYEQTEGSFFLPVHIDQDALAQAAGDEAPELALVPFSDALQICINAKPDFDTLLAATATLPALAATATLPSSAPILETN